MDKASREKLKARLVELRDKLEDHLDNLDGTDDDNLDAAAAGARFDKWIHANPYYFALICVGVALMFAAFLR